MSERGYDEELEAAQLRAEEARQAWRRAREEMRQAFRRGRQEERSGARGAPGTAELDADVQEMMATARDFAGEVADEARRAAQELWRDAKKDWQASWREAKKDWQSGWRDQGGHQGGKDWHGHWVFGGRRFRQWASGGEEVNPLVASLLSRGGGLLSLYVLHLLAEQPRHGNDIMKQLESRTLGAWSSNPGAIYPLLSLMEEKGLVQSAWEDPDKRTRRVYQITAEGRRELVRLRGALRPKVMEAIEVLHGLYDDLYAGSDDSPVGGDEASAGATGAGEPGAGGPMGEPEAGGEAEPRQEFDATSEVEPLAPRPRRFGWFLGHGQAWRRPLGA